MQMASSCIWMRCKIIMLYFFPSSCDHRWQVKNLKGFPMISIETFVATSDSDAKKSCGHGPFLPWSSVGLRVSRPTLQRQYLRVQSSPFQPGLHQTLIPVKSDTNLELTQYQESLKKDFHLYIFYKIIRFFQPFNVYLPGNWHIPTCERDNHLQQCLVRGYVSSLDGICIDLWQVAEWWWAKHRVSWRRSARNTSTANWIVSDLVSKPVVQCKRKHKRQGFMKMTWNDGTCMVYLSYNGDQWGILVAVSLKRQDVVTLHRKRGTNRSAVNSCSEDNFWPCLGSMLLSYIVFTSSCETSHQILSYKKHDQ